MALVTLSGPQGTAFTTPTRLLGRISLSDIKLAVCKHFQITQQEIESARRSRKYARPRQIAMTLSRELTDNSYPSIGKRYGNRDHTTVIHAQRRIAELRAINPRVEAHYQAVRSVLLYGPANDAEGHGG